MSHALSMMAGALMTVAALKTTQAEPVWAALFLIAGIVALFAWGAANDERTRG